MSGLRQGGIAEAVMQAVNASPEEVRSLLLANIVLVGGNFKFPGFLERLCILHKNTLTDRQQEVRSKAPASTFVRFIMPPESFTTFHFLISSPITCAWEGGSELVSNKAIWKTKMVTRKEYMEHGSNICSARFDTPRTIQEGGGKDLNDDDDVY